MTSNNAVTAILELLYDLFHAGGIAPVAPAAKAALYNKVSSIVSGRLRSSGSSANYALYLDQASRLLDSATNIPPLNPEQVEVFEQSVQAIESPGSSILAAAFLAALRFETGGTAALQPVDAIQGQVDVLMLRYGLLCLNKGMEQISREQSVAGIEASASYDARLRELGIRTDNEVKRLDKLSSTLSEAGKAAEVLGGKIQYESTRVENLNALVAKSASDTNDVDDIISATRDKIENLLVEVRQKSSDMTEWKDQVRKAADEALNLNTVHKLWSGRALRAQVAFWFATVFLGVLMIGVPAFAWWNLEAAGASLRRLESFAVPPMGQTPSAAELTAYAITRLVGISVPLALYFWVIRLVIRYWNRCMLLQDDAKARHTMLETYYRLIERQGATPKEDRAIVLNSLFRPVPGHGNDSADAPNIGEITNNFIQPKPAS